MTDVAGKAEELVRALQGGDRSVCAQLLAMSDEEFLAVLPRLCAFLASYDPRLKQGARRAAPVHASKIFAKWSEIGQQKPDAVRRDAAAMCEMVEWWAALLVNSDGELVDLAEATEHILTTWSAVASADRSFAGTVLPSVLACLASTDDELVQAASGIVTVITVSNKDAVAERADLALDVLDRGVADAAAASLLGSVFNVYERNSDAVHAHIDTIVAYTLRGTVSRATGSQLLSKIAKRAPRLLYGFVEDLLPLLDDPRSCYMALSVLVDLSLHNALLVRPHLNRLAQASAGIPGGFLCSAPAIGRIGRIDRQAAAEAQAVLARWLQDDLALQALPVIVAEIRNIGGVYKGSLEPHMDVIRSLVDHDDHQVSELAKEIISYYDGDAPYMYDAFLLGQQDIFGRVIKVADDSAADTSATCWKKKKSIAELSRRADHREYLLSSQGEEVHLPATDAGRVADRVNVLEVASYALAAPPVDVVEAPMEQLQELLQSRAPEMKEFIAAASKKLPIPHLIQASGRIRKRMAVKIRCARGTSPDFVFETADWSKWLRLAICAAGAGTPLLTGGAVPGALEELQKMFDALKRNDIDAQLTFQALAEEPILTSNELDDLVHSLHNRDFFRVFERDAEAGTWHRKQVVPEPEEPEIDVESIPPPPALEPEAESKHDVPADEPDSYASWVVKVGQVFHTKKKRWLVLKNRTLSYYTDQSMRVKRGEFPIRMIQSISPLGADNWFTLTLHPTVHNGELKLRVASEQEYAKWVDAIRAAV